MGLGGHHGDRASWNSGLSQALDLTVGQMANLLGGESCSGMTPPWAGRVRVQSCNFPIRVGNF